MFTTLNKFADNSTEVVKDFMVAGQNNSTLLKIPKTAILKSATVQVRGELLDVEDFTINDTTAEFAPGILSNLSLANGSLYLRPFVAHRSYAAGNAPVAVVAGDIDKDGKTDLVAVNSGSNNIGAFIQNFSLGKMEAQVTYATGNSPQGAAIGDLNFDGRADVAVACSAAGVLNVFYQDSSGVLATPATAYPAGNGARSVAIGDFNKDGRKDAVVANSGANTVSLFLQNNMTAVLELNCTVATGATPWVVAAADIDFDGSDEVIVLNKGDSNISVYNYNMSKGLEFLEAHATGTTPVSMAIGDVNQDGRLDVVVAESAGTSIGILTQNSTGGLNARVGMALAAAPSSVAVGDVSYDGRNDIVVAIPSINNVSLFYQNTDGTFTEPDTYAVGTNPQAVIVADLNYDGKKDVGAANNGDGTVGVLALRPTAPGTMPAVVTTNSGTSPHSVDTGQLNGDGMTDFGVALWNGNQFSVFTQNKNGLMNAAVGYQASTGCVDVEFGDFNLDGRTDAVTTSWYDDEVSVFMANTQGTFDTRVAYPLGVAAAMVATGDFNSDGLIDFVTANHGAFISTEKNISVFYNNASSGGFDGPINYSCGAVPTGIAAGDINNDGRTDLVVSNQNDDNLGMYYQNVSGVLDPMIVLSAGNAPIGVAVGDVSSDGVNDIVTVHGGGNTLGVYLGNADGTMATSAVIYSTGTSPYLVTTGDVNSDGRTDVIVSNMNSNGMGSVGVFTQKTDGTLNAQVAYNTGQGSGPAGVAVGDLNTDGKNDIVECNDITNSMGIFRQVFNAELTGNYSSVMMKCPYEIVEATPFWNLTETATNQTVKVDVTNNGGSTWTSATSGSTITFFGQGNTLGYRLSLTSSFLNSTPYFENITIHYRMRSYPNGPALDIGGLGTPVWNRTGPFGADDLPAVVDFTERLNATLQGLEPDANGTVLVEFAVSAGSLGRLRLSNLTVQYDLAPKPPALQNLRNGVFITTQTPSFKITGFDNDTSDLKFKLELSQNNFTTLKAYNQLSTTDGWDKSTYKPGDVATYRLADYDKLTVDGEYQWRAYVWDGMVWSGASEWGSFRLDTRAPTAKVTQLPPFVNTTKFSVNWTGEDPDPGSGLAINLTFDIQFKDKDNAPWMDWLLGINESAGTFTGEHGKTYFFQARARDQAGNVGSYMMGQGDTCTRIDTTPPTGTVSDDGEIWGDYTKLHASFSFTDSESDIMRYEYWIGTAPGEGNNDTKGPIVTDQRDITVTGLTLMNGTRYYWTVRAQNGAGTWSRLLNSDGINVRLKMPVPGIAYPNEAQKENTIEIFLKSTDPNNAGFADADLEYRFASVQSNRELGDWSKWTEIGSEDWGDSKPGADPVLFNATAGNVYKFRYRVRDRLNTTSDYIDPGNVTRINRPPVPNFFEPTGLVAGKKITFSGAISTDPDGDTIRYTWDFGDKKSEYGAAEVTHKYAKGGKFKVTLYADDGLDNVTKEMTIAVSDAPTQFNMGFLWILIAVCVVAGVVGALYFVMTKRKKTQNAKASEGEKNEAGDKTAAPSSGIKPVSSTPAPPPAVPLTATEVETQIAAAKETMDEIKADGIDTARVAKMIGLAESFLADGNLETASQYAKKAVKLSKDQKERKESEVDEETAKKFINETGKLMDEAESQKMDVRQARKLYGLSISFQAEGNYVTGMKYSKKVRKILDELKLRGQDGAPPKLKEGAEGRLAVEAEIEAATTLMLDLKKSGENITKLEGDLDMAHLLFDEDKYDEAMKFASKARKNARDQRERSKPPSPAELKELGKELRERIEKAKGEGLRTTQSEKMLKLSESFALSGNLSVSAQYMRKSRKLMDDIEDRAMVDAAQAARKEKDAEDAAKGAAETAGENAAVGAEEDDTVELDEDDWKAAIAAGKCPNCGEDIEAGWVVCPSCNIKLNESPDGGEGAAPRAKDAKDERAPKEGTEDAPAPKDGEGEAKPGEKSDEPKGDASGSDGGKTGAPDVKPELPAEGKNEGAEKLKCPSCGLEADPTWTICPACDIPLKK